MVDAMVAGSSPQDLYYEYYQYADPYQCPLRPDHYGPVTVPMVSTSSSPPIAMPVQVPHGHVVQQIVDESGTLRHVILSPQHHPPMLPIPQHFAGGGGGGGGGAGGTAAAGYYQAAAAPLPPPHGYSPFNPLQPPSPMPQHPQGHSPPPPLNFHKDERTQRQFNKLKRKLEQKQLREPSVNNTPPLSPRKELNGSGRKGVGSVATSEDGEESSSLHEEEEDASLANLLSTIKPPQVSEVSSRSALVQWSAPGVEQPHLLSYEVLLTDRVKEGKYKSIYCGEALSCRIEDLRPGTEYSVCVSARLESTVGRPSEPEVLITPSCRPDPPPPPKLSSRTRNTLTLKWSGAVENGSHIDCYVVEWEVEGRWAEVARTKSRQAHIAKLQPATPFKFRVAAVNHHGKSEFSESVVYETCDSPPAQPAAPVVSRATPTSLSVEWVQRPHDDEFTLQMEQPDTKHGFLAVYNGKETCHTCTHLKNNTSYKFRLKSQNEEGASKWSEEVEYSTIPGRPGPPSRPHLKGRLHPHSLRVQWSPPQDRGGAPITAYHVQILASTTTGGEWQTVYSGGSPCCTIDKLTPGTAYQVRVWCEGAGGRSDPSEAALFATEAVCPGQCGPPRLAGKPRPHSIPLKWAYPEWDGGAQVTELELAVRECDTDTSPRTVYVGKETEHTVTDLTPAAPYAFTLRATNRVGSGSWSEALEVRCGSAAPGRPAPPTVVVSGSSVVASWSAPACHGSPISAYCLQVATGPGASPSTFQQAYHGSATTTELKNLPPATLALFRLQVVNGVGWSEWSEVSSVVTRAGVPGIVAAIKTEPTPTSLQVWWSAPPDNGEPITHYLVEAGDASLTVTEPPCLLDNLLPATSYRIRVRGVNSVGAGVAGSVKASTVPLPPRPPTLTCPTIAHNYLKLRWASSNPDNHHFTVHITSPNSRRSVVYEGTNTTCKVNKLHEQTEYSFTISAANRTGCGPPSAAICFTTSTAPPPPVKGVKVTEVTGRSCQVEWTPLRPMASDALEYVVQCSRLRDMTYKQVYRGGEVRCWVRELEAGADYVVRVAGVRLCEGGARPIDGAFSPTVTVSTPPPSHHHDHPPTATPTSHPRHHNHQLQMGRMPLSDNQWAGIILCCFTVIAVFFAMMVANIIY